MDYIIPWKEQQIESIELIKLYQFEKDLILQIKICNEAFQIMLTKYESYISQSNILMIYRIEQIIKKMVNNNYQRNYNLKLIQKVISEKEEFVIG